MSLTNEPTNSQLWAALARAQANVKNPKKNAKNEYSGYSYCTIGSVLDAAREALTAEQLVLLHGGSEMARLEEGGMIITKHVFLLAHASGGSIALNYQLPLDTKSKAPPDKCMLAATTAVRRYATMSILGMSTGDEPDIDDRGDSVTDGRPSNSKAKPKTNRSPKKPAVTKAPTQSVVTGEPSDWFISEVWTTRKDGNQMTDSKGNPLMRVLGMINGEEQTVWVRDLGLHDKVIDGQGSTVQAVFDAVKDRTDTTKLAVTLLSFVE